MVAAYDHLEDAIVLNLDHPAWSDMRGLMRRQQARVFYSTGHPQHIVRHELGHAAHYRALSLQERERVWFAESLRPGEELMASVSQHPGDLESQRVGRRGLRWPLGRRRL